MKVIEKYYGVFIVIVMIISFVLLFVDLNNYYKKCKQIEKTRYVCRSIDGSMFEGFDYECKDEIYYECEVEND